jgi:myosin-crossreactive antigen
VQTPRTIEEIEVNKEDFVIVTLGSMTESSSFGSMDAAPVLNGKSNGGSWALWEKIAAGRPQFGRPANFTDHIEESKWISFTTTLHDPTFFHLFAISRATSREKVASSLSRNQAGWRRSFYLISRILSGSHRTFRSSGAMAFSSISRATS